MDCPPILGTSSKRAWCRDIEESEATDAPSLSLPCWSWDSMEDETYELADPYEFNLGMPYFPEASLIMGTQVAESLGNLYYTEPSSASNLPGNSSCSTTSSIKSPTIPTSDNNISGMPLTQLFDCSEKMPTTSQNNEVHVSGQEQQDNKRRKRSVSSDDQKAVTKEQRRVESIIRHLERFENQQKRYGKRQLKAIEDSAT